MRLTRRRGCLIALVLFAGVDVMMFPCAPGLLLSRLETSLHSSERAQRLLATINPEPPSRFTGPGGEAAWHAWSEATLAGLRERVLAVDGWDTIVILEPYSSGASLADDERLGSWLIRYQIGCVGGSSTDSAWQLLAISDGMIMLNVTTYVQFRPKGSLVITRAP